MNLYDCITVNPWQLLCRGNGPMTATAVGSCPWYIGRIRCSRCYM